MKIDNQQQQLACSKYSLWLRADAVRGEHERKKEIERDRDRMTDARLTKREKGEKAKKTNRLINKHNIFFTYSYNSVK
jgi:hypothetical protein